MDINWRPTFWEGHSHPSVGPLAAVREGGTEGGTEGRRVVGVKLALDINWRPTFWEGHSHPSVGPLAAVREGGKEGGREEGHVYCLYCLSVHTTHLFLPPSLPSSFSSGPSCHPPLLRKAGPSSMPKRRPSNLSMPTHLSVPPSLPSGPSRHPPLPTKGRPDQIRQGGGGVAV